MPAVFENLNVRRWYTVIEIEQEDAEPFCIIPRRAPRCTGAPILLMAASYPFVTAKTIAGAWVTFDTRTVTLSSATDQYVAAWRRSWEDAGRPTAGTQKPPKVSKRKKKTKPDRYTCPRCGGHMVQRMVIVADGWKFVCRECGYTGNQEVRTP